MNMECKIYAQVDDALVELDGHVPSLVKHVSTQALTAVHKALEVARSVVAEVQRSGVVDSAKNITITLYANYEPTAKELYYKYEPVAEQYAVSAWRSLNRLPLFPQLAQMAVPTAACWSERYNQAVRYSAENGYAVALYLPLIPVERIAKVFEDAETGPTVSSNGEAHSVAQ